MCQDMRVSVHKLVNHVCREYFCTMSNNPRTLKFLQRSEPNILGSNYVVDVFLVSTQLPLEDSKKLCS